MEVTNTIGAAALVRKYLESDAGHDLLAEMVKTTAELLMDAEVDVLCNAGYGERTEARVNSRNGHRDRRWDTRAGTITLEIPKLRKGRATCRACSSPGGVPSRRSSRWSARPTSRACPPGGSTTW